MEISTKRSFGPAYIAACLAAAALATSLASPSPAPAAQGFGYDDPRSAQIDPLDVSPLGGDAFLGVDFSGGSGEILRYENGSLSRIAGGGKREPSADKAIPADELRLFSLQTVAAAGDGYLATLDEQVIRADARNRIRVVAGTGSGGGTREDGVPATEARLSLTHALDPLPGGGFLIGETDRIREVGTDGRIRTVVGPGNGDGDAIPAADVRVASAYGVLALPDGGLLFTDRNRVRELSPGGIVTTIAGTGDPGFSGDGGPAIAAELNIPFDLAMAADGSILVSDFANFRVRRIAPDGTITTVAGNGGNTFNGDGIAATEAGIQPQRIAATDDGGFLLTDTGRIREVGPDGTIATLAGMPAADHCDSAPYSGHQGNAGSNRLQGGPRRDLMRGEGASDRLIGRDAGDCLLGGDANDEMLGGSGPDVLHGERQGDLLRGGKGRDLLDGGNRSDRLFGGGGRDQLEGGKADDRLDGGRGKDLIEGGPDADVLIGGRGDDRLVAAVDFHIRDVVRCGRGRDTALVDSADRVARSCERVKVI